MTACMLHACHLRSGSFTSGRPVARSSKLNVAARGRALSAQVRADNVLIANTKGGGHAFIGLHLAKELLDGGHSVTILNDGDEVRRLCMDNAWQGIRHPCNFLQALYKVTHWRRRKLKARPHTTSMTAYSSKGPTSSGATHQTQTPSRLGTLMWFMTTMAKIWMHANLSLMLSR